MPFVLLVAGSAQGLTVDASDPLQERIVLFADGAAAGDVLADHGITHAVTLKALPYALVRVPASAAASLGADDRIAGITTNPPLQFLMDTAINSTRVRDVQEGFPVLAGGLPPGKGPDGGGPPGHRKADPEVVSLDGSGVGIAIVDTGVDCTHPDLAARCVPNRNMKCEGDGAVRELVGLGSRSSVATCVPMEETDWGLNSGHGTHVAGIAVGDGTASAGRIRGVAPGASLYGYGAIQTGWGWLAAYDHILSHPSEPGHPPIRVVSNSFSVSDTADPPLFAQAIRRMVDAGIVVVFAAGNTGDAEAGDSALFSGPNPICMVRGSTGEPLAGLVCVGSAVEGNQGTAAVVLARGSSRGFTDDLSTWPDVVAPGWSIYSTRAASATLLLPSTDPEDAVDNARYGRASGTSMAAPHVAGVVALLLEAAPWLEPAHVDATLKESAYPYSSGTPFPNRHAGAGLVDARAAIERSLEMRPTPMDNSLLVNIVTQFFYGVLKASALHEAGVGDEQDVGYYGEQQADNLGIVKVEETLEDVRVLPPHPDGRIFLEGLLAYPAERLGRFGATLTVDLHYRATNLSSEVELPYDRGRDRFVSSTLAHRPGVDGDVEVTWRFDVAGDGVFDPSLDVVHTVVYIDSG